MASRTWSWTLTALSRTVMGKLLTLGGTANAKYIMHMLDGQRSLARFLLLEEVGGVEVLPDLGDEGTLKSEHVDVLVDVRRATGHGGGQRGLGRHAIAASDQPLDGPGSRSNPIAGGTPKGVDELLAADHGPGNSLGRGRLRDPPLDLIGDEGADRGAVGRIRRRVVGPD